MEVECACGWYHETKCPVAKALRNCWCTPKWIADLIGVLQLDPCSNERSHIKAEIRLRTEDGDNGLVDDPGYTNGEPGVFQYHVWDSKGRGGDLVTAPAWWRVFINPPYANGQVIRWVRHYRHTRFIYLLRWDPSTEWFSELLPHCTYVWFPPSRVDFEPPPRIKESSNPYPHALYLRDPPPELLARLKSSGFLFDVPALTTKTSEHGHQQIDPANGERGDNTGGDRNDRSRPARAGEGGRGDALGPSWRVPNPEKARSAYCQQLEDRDKE